MHDDSRDQRTRSLPLPLRYFRRAKLDRAPEGSPPILQGNRSQDASAQRELDWGAYDPRQTAFRL